MNIFVAGHNGMVGSAIIRALSADNKNKIITADRSEVNLLNQASVEEFFKKNNIDQVYLAAAKVGGIFANNHYPAQFIYENILIQANVIHSSHTHNIQKILLLGSSCIYPKFSTQPINESALLTGSLEETNEPYAISKIAGIKLCESYNRQYQRDYRSVMPCNLYGPNDNFHPDNSHVIPALIRKIHNAKLRSEEQVDIWGSGEPLREFLHVDDLASASIFLMNLDIEKYNHNTNPMLSHINIGAGTDLTIKELAERICMAIGWDGMLVFDKTKPDGTPRKLMDISRVQKLGWSPKIELNEGLESTYYWFLENQKIIRS